jgi:hypothetical protein
LLPDHDKIGVAKKNYVYLNVRLLAVKLLKDYSWNHYLLDVLKRLEAGRLKIHKGFSASQLPGFLAIGK